MLIERKREIMTETKQKTFSTLDLYLSSFLSLCGICPNLEIRNGKVIFTFFATDKLYKLMMDFNSNVSVPVADFVTTIKSLRGKMITVKGENIGNERENKYNCKRQ